MGDPTRVASFDGFIFTNPINGTMSRIFAFDFALPNIGVLVDVSTLAPALEFVHTMPIAIEAGAMFSQGDGSGSSGGSQNPNQDALDEMRRREELYRRESNIDCSEIAEDLFEASGRNGKIIEIRANDGWLWVEEYGNVRDFNYHTVFSDGRFIFDPRFSPNPILEVDYFNMLRRLNPGGFNTIITHP